jgi:hypothetical protein
MLQISLNDNDLGDIGLLHGNAPNCIKFRYKPAPKPVTNSLPRDKAGSSHAAERKVFSGSVCLLLSAACFGVVEFDIPSAGSGPVNLFDFAIQQNVSMCMGGAAEFVRMLDSLWNKSGLSIRRLTLRRVTPRIRKLLTKGNGSRAPNLRDSYILDFLELGDRVGRSSNGRPGDRDPAVWSP